MFRTKTRAVARGGDQWLYHWRSADADTLKLKPENLFKQHVGYEDRDSWVRELLAQESEDQAAAYLASQFPGRTAVILVGQEEDRASGSPIRLVHVVMYRGDRND